MNRSFLYAVVVLLAGATGLVYVQKTNPDFLGGIMGKKQPDAWQKDDPGWSQGGQLPPQDMPPAQTPPAPEQPPQTQPTPPQQPQQPPQTQPQHRRRHPQQPQQPQPR